MQLSCSTYAERLVTRLELQAFFVVVEYLQIIVPL